MLTPKIKFNDYGRLWRPEWIRPYESLWGIWQRYKQVNVMCDYYAIADCGKKAGSCIVFSEKYGLYINSQLLKIDFDATLLIPDNHFDTFLKPLFHISAFQAKEMHYIVKEELVYCPICLKKNGFHSYLHQIAGLKHCPWHSDQTLVTSSSIKYLIDKGDKYAFNSDIPDKISIPLPVVTPDPTVLKPLHIPYKKILIFFKSISEVNVFYYLTDVKDDFRIIAMSDEEIGINSRSEKEELIRFFYPEVAYNSNMHDDLLIVFNKENPFFYLKKDNYFYSSIFIYKWICEQLSNFQESEISKYILEMDEGHINLNPERLPNKKLVALLRCARAIAYVRDYSDARSKYIIIHPQSRMFYPFTEGIHFEYSHYIEKKMFELVWYYAEDPLPDVFFIYQTIMMDYLDSVMTQLLENPYVCNLTKIKEPHYIVAQLEDGSWGYYRFL